MTKEEDNLNLNSIHVLLLMQTDYYITFYDEDISNLKHTTHCVCLSIRNKEILSQLMRNYSDEFIKERGERFDNAMFHYKDPRFPPMRVRNHWFRLEDTGALQPFPDVINPFQESMDKQMGITRTYVHGDLHLPEELLTEEPTAAMEKLLVKGGLAKYIHWSKRILP